MDFKPAIERMMANMPDFTPPRTPFQVDYVFEGLRDRIREFERSLDENTEVGVWLASFGTSMLMHVRRITYREPSFICFSGYVDGQKSELVQHMNQISFLIVAVPKSNPDQPPRRIGFG